ncbi:MAG: PQQ-dependent sugar dehydrogenase [Planctomycetaceae bacterium]|nr:PQQ-dependent sugar dehydrogenase [Planctomycetaceae bacterium]
MSQLRFRTLTLSLAVGSLLFSGCITTRRVGTGFSQPTFLTALPGVDSHVAVLEKGGRVQLMSLEDGGQSTYLDLTSVVRSSENERGLLGVAFAPDFSSSGVAFVAYTAQPDGALHVVRYEATSLDPPQGNPASAQLILRVPQPQANHNGGWIGFREADRLYISLGDGGGDNDDDAGHTDAIGNGQDTNVLLGKILRINPNPDADAFPDDADRNYAIPPDNPFVGVAGDDAIWNYGLRNPWRCSFDRQTGDFWIADVGQGAREEVNFQLANSTGGENYGWRLREGTIATPGSVGGPPPSDAVEPIYDYGHGSGGFEGRSITGGYVYRGPIADLQGQYFFADYVSQRIWSFTRSGNTVTDLTDWTSQFRPDVGTIGRVSSFGEDNIGNLYIVDFDGDIFRVTDARRGNESMRNVSRRLVLPRR